jgi:hypothetical protein
MQPVDLKVFRIISWEARDKDGICSLSQVELAQQAQISRRTLCYSLARLKAGKFISSEQQRDGGRFGRTLYRVHKVHKHILDKEKNKYRVHNIIIGVLIDRIKQSGFTYRVNMINIAPLELQKTIEGRSPGYYRAVENFTRRKRLVLTQNNVIIRGFIIKKKIQTARLKLELATIKPQPPDKGQATAQPRLFSVNNTSRMTENIVTTGREPPTLPTMAVNGTNPANMIRKGIFADADADAAAA